MLKQEQIKTWMVILRKAAKTCRKNAVREVNTNKQQTWLRLADNHDCQINTLRFVLQSTV